MEKTTESLLTSANMADNLKPLKQPVGLSRFQCQALSPQPPGEDEDDLEDEEDGFQCPCCLTR